MTLTWSAGAACRGIDPTVFFPVDDETAGAAKAVCQGCDVRGPCLDHALGSPERSGVWGGCTEAERRRILRRRRRAS